MVQSSWEDKELTTDLGYGELFKILWRRRFLVFWCIYFYYKFEYFDNFAKTIGLS